MNEICEKAQEFVSDVLTSMRFKAKVEAEWSDEGCCVDISGEDSHFALTENGELLDALEVLLFQTMGRDLGREHRFVVDADGFRKTRKAELHAMARFAADQ